VSDSLLVHLLTLPTANAGRFSLQPRLLPAAGVLRRVCERLASARAPRRAIFVSDLRSEGSGGTEIAILIETANASPASVRKVSASFTTPLA
jgi:hypothetical protein